MLFTAAADQTACTLPGYPALSQQRNLRYVCMLNSELGIFYALAMTSFFWIGRTRAEGEAVVLVSYPSRDPGLWFLLSCLFFLASSIFNFMSD